MTEIKTTDELAWFTAEALRGLPGLPKSPSSISRKATNEGWSKRRKEGVRGVTYEYAMSSLPMETQHYLVTEQNQKEWFTLNDIEGADGLPVALCDLVKLAEDQSWEKKVEDGATYYHVANFPQETQLALRHNLKRTTMLEMAQKHARQEPPKQSFDFEQEFALIPGYRIQVSAGQGALNGDALEPTRYLAFRKKWLKYRGFSEKDLVIVWAKGDSMEPTIHNNDTVVVHTGRTKPQDGHIYIFRNGDELFVKRYQSMLASWRLISDNPIYAPLDIPKEDQHQFEVVGQVVHVAKDFGE